MSGDVEFVNTFMAKMKDKLHDHLGQVVMLETHNELALKRLESMQEANQELQKMVDDKELEIGIISGRLSAMEMKAENLEADKSELSKQLETYKNLSQNAVDELNRIRADLTAKNNEEHSSYISQINTLQSELDGCKKMEQTLIKDFRDLQKKYDEAINPKPTVVKKPTK